MENVLVIIPVLNEESTIAGVLRQLQQQGLFNICVVDNGSEDQTSAIATQQGAIVISEPKRGYGQACWRGLQSEQALQAEWILFCDGDGSDDLSQLPDLLALRAEFDFILGNRRGTVAGRSRLTPAQNFGNWLATRLIRFGWGYAYEDLGPLRLIRQRALDRLAMADRGFGWTVEMQAKAAEQGLRICERPVNYLPRQGGRSKIAGTVRGSLKAGQIILLTLAKLYGQKLKATVIDRPDVQRGLLWAIALLIMLGSCLAAPHGDFLNQPDAVPLFWRGMGLMSLGFVGSWALQKVGAGWFWGVAIAPRLVLLTMYPGDDIWRYLWEGHLQNLGFNPYLLAPSADVLAPFRFEWWPQINHSDLAAIYPPITQLGFRILAAISPAVLLFKSAFILADLGICWLLSARFGHRATLLYAWNPLVIYSFAGGGHYDSWFLLPLVIAWLWWERFVVSPASFMPVPFMPAPFTLAPVALALGTSIGVKWVSLPIVGFLAWRLVCQPVDQRIDQENDQEIDQENERPNKRQRKRNRWCWGIVFLFLCALPIGLATLPFCQGFPKALTCPIIPLSSPFVLYGRSAAFIPQIAASVWPTSIRMNWIFALPLCAVIVWNFRRSVTLIQFTERYFVALMLLSPVIHAWYFTWLVPFAVASRHWGTQLVSVSAFVYFALPHNLATHNLVAGSNSWMLSDLQRWLLWGPFILGLVASARSAQPSD
ncbi:MAG: glycosyltransferase family 2 protein [Phormidesmis sp.]